MVAERLIEFAGRSILLKTSDIDAPDQRAVAARIERELARFDATARATMLREHAAGTAVQEYIEHHLSALPSKILRSLFETAEASSIAPSHFLARLVLQRVAIYPQDETQTAVLDYTLDEGATDYLLVVSFDATGEVISIEMES